MSRTATTLVDHLAHWSPPTVETAHRVDATGVEGYPDLVVHGPLLALELPRTHAPAERVAEFAYRLVRPAFSPATVVAAGVRLASAGAAG